MDVAVVRKEDTGICTNAEGEQLADSCSVTCDSDSTQIEENNAYLLSKNHGDHSFDGADFDTGRLGDARHHVVVKFDIANDGTRRAKFHYFLKKGAKRLPGDPYYLTVVNGKRYPIYVKERVG